MSKLRNSFLPFRGYLRIFIFFTTIHFYSINLQSIIIEASFEYSQKIPPNPNASQILPISKNVPISIRPGETEKRNHPWNEYRLRHRSPIVGQDKYPIEIATSIVHYGYKTGGYVSTGIGRSELLTITHPDSRSRTCFLDIHDRLTSDVSTIFYPKTVASRFGGTAVTIITPYRENRQRVVGSHAGSPMGCTLSGLEPCSPPFSIPLEERWKRYIALWESRSLESRKEQTTLVSSHFISSVIRAI